MLPVQSILPLIMFMALLLDLALLVLAVSGHFPREHNKSERVASVDIYGSIIVGLLAAIVAIAAAIKLIPWYAAVIGGGIAVLCAPLLLQKFSDNFVDGRGSLMAFSAIAVLLTLVFFFLTGAFPR